MAANRLLKALGQINPEQAAQIYGSEFAFDLPNRLGSTTPIERVAIFAESFLPKVDGISNTAYLTARYLQEPGREVLVFPLEIAPTKIRPSKVVPMPSFGFKVAPETRV